MYLVSGFLYQVHHIDSHNYRNAKLHDLSGEIKVSLKVGTIYNIDDRIWHFIDQVISGNYFLKCVWGKGINTRKIHDGYILVTFQFTFFFLYRYTWPVTNELVRAGQCIE